MQLFSLGLKFDLLWLGMLDFELELGLKMDEVLLVFTYMST